MIRNHRLGWSALALRAAAIAIVLAVVAIGMGSSRPAQADSGGLAYDEIVKIDMGGLNVGEMTSPPPGQSSNATPAPAAPPEPGVYQNGSFAADFQAAVNAGATPKPHGGLFGSVLNAEAMAKSAMAMIRVGTPSTHYFLNGWERTDDPVHQTATIHRADLHETIELNLANKTYSIIDMNAQSMQETPPPYQRPQNPGQPPPTQAPGTVKLAITASTAALGSKSIDGQPTSGYKTDLKVVTTQATGSCSNGTFEMAMSEYLSRYNEPTVAQMSGPPVHKQSLSSHPEMMAMKPGCKPTVSTHTNLGVKPPAGKLAMWQRVTLSAAAGQTSQAGPGSGQFSTIVSRGNLRALGAADKSLFEIPAGFTKVENAGS